MNCLVCDEPEPEGAFQPLLLIKLPSIDLGARLCSDCANRVSEQTTHIMSLDRNDVHRFADELCDNLPLTLNPLQKKLIGFRLIALAAVRANRTAKSLIDEANRNGWSQDVIWNTFSLKSVSALTGG